MFKTVLKSKQSTRPHQSTCPSQSLIPSQSNCGKVEKWYQGVASTNCPGLFWRPVPTLRTFVDTCGTILTGSGPLMPYDDRSNYEKGSTEELGQWYTTTLRKRQLRGEASLSLIEDPRPRLQAHFFQSSSVTRIVATQHNKTQLPAVATVGLSLFQTTYCFTSPAICGDGFRCWKPTKLREGHEDQHCDTGLGNKKKHQK